MVTSHHFTKQFINKILNRDQIKQKEYKTEIFQQYNFQKFF